MKNLKTGDVDLAERALELALALDDVIEQVAEQEGNRLASITEEQAAVELQQLDGASASGVRGFGAVVERWLGTLSAWSLQPAVADVPLAANLPVYAAVQSDLESLFQPAVLDSVLPWAAGPLLVGAIYDNEGSIRSVRASVGVRSGQAGAAMILELTDGEGHSVALRLAPERSFDVRSAPGIRGRLEDLALRLLTAVPT